MADTLYSSPSKENPKKKNLIILLLSIALAGSWGYFLWDQSNKKDTITTQSTTIETLGNEKAAIQQEFDQALARLDSVNTNNTLLQEQLSERQKEIEQSKSAIRKILNDRNATQKELAQARSMVTELNTRIANLEAEVTRLTGENQALTEANTNLQGEKTALEGNLQRKQAENEALSRTVDVGSTFSASSIQIASIDVRKSGKERITSTAKRVDKLLVSFDVENRIANSGPADMYLILTGPDGKIIGQENNILITRENGERRFSERVTVNYEKGSRQRVEFPIKGEGFQKGNYRMEIYHNGFRIGQSVRPLK
jgi:peptidoglycan hydrolase CwlO-like protein